MTVVEKLQPSRATAPLGAAELRGAVVLHNVSWETYQTLRQEEDNDNLRMTYDRGELEIMSPQKKHGKIGALLDQMIRAWTRFRCVEIESGGNLTCAREEHLRGLEPDLCYWITNQPVVHGRDEYDILVDPPPDLALEVDATRNSLPKLPIYAALKVPEVWRWRNGLEVSRLQSDGSYGRSDVSAALPGFPIKLADDFLERRNAIGENALVVQFEAAIAAIPME